MKCWICRDNPADSRERIPKAADLRGYFPQISKNNPIFRHTDETDTSLNYRINSPKSNYLKLGYSTCKKCNNELTQPYDYAWDIFLEHLQNNWALIVEKGYFSLSNIFPKDTTKSALRVHLYFVKLFGCKLIDERVPILRIDALNRQALANQR